MRKADAFQLQMLRKAAPKLRKKLINSAPDHLIRTISECSLNVLRGNVRLNKRQHKKLAPYKKILRGLAKSTSLPARKRLINQRGGFLGALLGPLLGAILPAVGGIFGLGKK